MNLERSSGILLHPTSFPSLMESVISALKLSIGLIFSPQPNARFGKYCLSVRPDTEILLISHFLLLPGIPTL